MHQDDAIQEDAPPVTEDLCQWIYNLTLDDVPTHVQTRAKYLILDGLACGIVGAHAPWSETASSSLRVVEPDGNSTVFGHIYKLSPLSATLLNSAFIQGCELDDYHHEAPLHSESVILPVVLAAAESRYQPLSQCQPSPAPIPISGRTLLLAAIVGFETGPRVGRALYGTELLSQGWHCGTVFAHPAAAASASKILGLDVSQTESAIGIACTQGCGLMSSQYGSMVKRMQHGFAARNGLLGAFLAGGGYGGIRRVLETRYGGFLAMFSKGNGRPPPGYVAEEVTRGLGETWDTAEIRVKTHACVGGAYGVIECIEHLQKQSGDQLNDLQAIKEIKLEVSRPLIGHCGWKAERPITSTGAQMNIGYIAAVQLVDRQVLVEQFTESNLDRDAVWELTGKATVVHNERFDRLTYEMGAVVTIEFNDGRPNLQEVVDKPRGMDPPVTNEEIIEKYRKLTISLLSGDRQKAIEDMVLNLEKLQDITELTRLLSAPFQSDLLAEPKS